MQQKLLLLLELRVVPSNFGTLRKPKVSLLYFGKHVVMRFLKSTNPQIFNSCNRHLSDCNFMHVRYWYLGLRGGSAVVRTLTGHRSNCISVDFHPFGEFFASGSLDTNLKIWDIRRKGCIHTYKGHTRGINSIKFSPDGRWVVSGGEDNIVKVRTLHLDDIGRKLLSDLVFQQELVKWSRWIIPSVAGSQNLYQHWG